MRHLCGTSVCARARHRNDTHGFFQSTSLAVSKLRLIASSTRRLIVEEKKRNPILVPPPLKVPGSLVVKIHAQYDWTTRVPDI